MIKERLKIIEDLQNEFNRVKSLLTETLEDTDEFQEIEEEKKKVREQSKEKQDRIMEKPQIKEFKEHMKELQLDIKDNKDLLSQELADHYKESGSNQIEDNEGHIKRMVFNVKLIDAQE